MNLLGHIEHIEIGAVKEADCIYVGGQEVRLSGFDTGKGWRRLFVCPSCGKRVMTLCHMVKFSNIVCRHCNNIEYGKYQERMRMKSSREIVDYKINRLSERIGVPYNYMDPFDESYYDNKRPKGMHRITYDRIVQKLFNLSTLRDKKCTVKEINENISDAHVDFIISLRNSHFE